MALDKGKEEDLFEDDEFEEAFEDEEDTEEGYRSDGVVNHLRNKLYDFIYYVYNHLILLSTFHDRHYEV